MSLICFCFLHRYALVACEKDGARAITTSSNDVARRKPFLRDPEDCGHPSEDLPTHPCSIHRQPDFCSSKKSFSPGAASPSPRHACLLAELCNSPRRWRWERAFPWLVVATCCSPPPYDGLSPLSSALAALAEGKGCQWKRRPGKQVTTTGSSGSLRDSAEV